MAAANNLTISFTSESSIEAELERESTADVLTILVGCFHRQVFGCMHILRSSRDEIFFLACRSATWSCLLTSLTPLVIIRNLRVLSLFNLR